MFSMQRSFIFFSFCFFIETENNLFNALVLARIPILIYYLQMFTKCMLHLTIYLLHRESGRRRNKLIKAVRWLPQFITAQIWQHYLVLNTLSYLHAFKFSTVNNFDLKQEPDGHCLSNNCMSKKWKNKLNKSKPPKLVLHIFTFSRILLTSSIQQYQANIKFCATRDC